MEAINELKKIENIQKDLEEKLRSVADDRNKILKEISASIRITEVSDPVLKLREKIMKTREIKSILEKHKIPIDDVALAKMWGDNLEYDRGNWYIGGYSDWPIRSDVIIDRTQNTWKVHERFLYGGPCDMVRVFFKQSDNGQYCLCGFITKFPIRPEEV